MSRSPLLASLGWRARRRCVARGRAGRPTCWSAPTPTSRPRRRARVPRPSPAGRRARAAAARGRGDRRGTPRRRGAGPGRRPDAAARPARARSSPTRRRCDVADFTAALRRRVGRGRTERAWQAAVDMTWRFAASTGRRCTRRCWSPSTPTERPSVGDHRRSAAGTGARPLWLTGPVEVRRSADVAGAGRRSAAEADLVAGARGRRRARRARRAAAVGRAAWSWRCPASEEALDAALARRAGHLRRHRRRLGVRGRHAHARLPGARLRQPRRLRRPRAGGRPGRDEPRGDPRRHRGAAHQRRAAVAARGVRRLRRAARRRPADLDDGRPDHRAGPRATGARTHLPGPGRVRRRPTRTSGRRTRAPGWPAWCSPTLAGEDALVRLYERRLARPGASTAQLRASCSASTEAGADRAVAGSGWQTWPRERPTARDPAVTGLPSTACSRLVARGGGRRACFVVLAVLLVPWDPVPGGPLHPPPASSVLHRRARSSAPRTTRRWARGLELVPRWRSRWSSLVRARLHPGRRPARGPAARPLVVAGRGRGRRARGGRPAASPCRSRSLLRRHVLELRPVEPGLGRVRRRPGQGPRRGRGGHLDRAGGARRRRPPLAARLAGGRRRCSWRRWCCSARSSTRCWSSRCSTTSAAAGRPAAHPDPRARRPRRACRSTTCWWPTRRGARRR